MARVKQIVDKHDIASEHYALFDELAALRGRISGPSTIVLHSPGLARPWNQISEYLHGQSVVKAPQAELAVCATARQHDCEYIWAAHVPQARNAGVSDATIEAVRNRLPLDGLPAEETLLVRFVWQLLQGNRVDSVVFDSLLQAHGARWIVDLIAWIGRYSALSGILNSFEVLPATDAEPLPVATGAAGGPKRPPVRAPLPTPRINPLTTRDQVAEADRAIFDSVAEARGSVRGPFSILMYSPDLCSRVIDLSNFLRNGSEVTPRTRELATIAVAREKDCPYVWAAHAPTARKEGIVGSTIAAVRDRTDLASLAPANRDVVEYARELLVVHRVAQPLFERLLKEHGVAWLVELTALIGHYSAISAVLNAVEVSPAPDAEPLPLI